MNALWARTVYTLAYGLFRSPFVRRSEALHHRVMKLFRYASERGDIKALSVYGSLLYFRGTDEGSRQQGALYLRQAAEQGDTKALYWAGQFYEKGVTGAISVDERKSLEQYQRAAELGHPLAIKRLIAIYETGELGETPDPGAVQRWKAKQ